VAHAKRPFVVTTTQAEVLKGTLVAMFPGAANEPLRWRARKRIEHRIRMQEIANKMVQDALEPAPPRVQKPRLWGEGEEFAEVEPLRRGERPLSSGEAFLARLRERWDRPEIQQLFKERL
jgi:hypothetical protein